MPNNQPGLEHTAFTELEITRKHLEAKSKVIEQLERDLKKCRLALGFFSSVIKSGEKWSAKCQRTYYSVKG